MAFPATFADIQSAVVDKARLDSTADSTRVKDWINNAYYTACIETNFYESSSAAAALAANATSVNIPTSIVKIEYITPTGADGTVWGPMQEVTFEEILELRAYQGGAISVGAPTKYAFRSASTPSIEFWPQAVGGEVLTFYGLAMPTALSSAGDVPIFPEPYSKVIEYGALIHAGEFKKDIILMDQYKGSYEDWLERFRAFNNVRAGSKVQQLRIENASVWPRRNDVDQGW